jgi:hypothetical protein
MERPLLFFSGALFHVTISTDSFNLICYFKLPKNWLSGAGALAQFPIRKLESTADGALHRSVHGFPPGCGTH